VTLWLRVEPVVARFVEIRVPKNPPNAWFQSLGDWAVHELTVHAPPAG
jgi:hypothetical protein